MNCLLSNSECAIILEKYIKKSTFQITGFKVKKFSETTLGHLGDHLLLTIYYIYKNNNKENKISFFIKCMPQDNKEQKEFIESLGVLHKEVVIYQHLATEMNTLVSTPFCPEFYFGRDDIIVLENLESKGYSITNDIYFETFRIEAVLKALARMHAASFMYERKRSFSGEKYKIINEIRDELTENQLDFIEGNSRNDWYKPSLQCVVELCKYFVGNQIDENKIYDYAKFKMPNKAGPSEKYPNVLCHDDLWRNNLMFNNNNECLLIDFQFAKYGPPVYDILVFLYFNTEEILLKEKFSEFLNFYFTTLEHELKLKSIDIQDILPKDMFLESIKDYSKPALLQVAVCSTYIFIPDEFIQKKMENGKIYEDFNFGNRSVYILEEIKKNKVLEKRFRNIIKPLCDMFI